jgi:putative protein kinase ArgK-like GTPase of G3E family
MQDLASVPAELIKHLLTLVLAFAGVWLAHKRTQQGSKDQPVNIAQPLSVQKHDDAAKRSELLRIEATLKEFGSRVDGLAEQINAQFAAMTKAGQDRVAAITQSMDAELHAISDKIEKFMLMTSRHDAVLPQIEDRLSELSKAHSDGVQRLHQRIDDAIRLNAPRKP